MRVNCECTLRILFLSSKSRHTVYSNRASLSKFKKLCDNGSWNTEGHFECCSRKSVRPSWQTQTCHGDPLSPSLFHTLSHTFPYHTVHWIFKPRRIAMCSIMLSFSLLNSRALHCACDHDGFTPIQLFNPKAIIRTESSLLSLETSALLFYI